MKNSPSSKSRGPRGAMTRLSGEKGGEKEAEHGQHQPIHGQVHLAGSWGGHGAVWKNGVTGHENPGGTGPCQIIPLEEYYVLYPL